MQAVGEEQEVVERAGALLRSRGERLTRPRRAVLNALAGRSDHLSAEEVFAVVALGAADVHLTTVYRSLEALCALGLVQHVHVPEGATRYHVVGSTSNGGHVHAQCLSCGRMLDLPGDVLADVAAQLSADHDFHLDPGHAALSGVCGPCARRATGP